MKSFDFRIILLGVIVLLAMSLTSCSMNETVEPIQECRNFTIEEVDFHRIQLKIHSENPTVEVCREAIVNGKSFGWECKTVSSHYYNCYGISGTASIEHLNISVDGCEKSAW